MSKNNSKFALKLEKMIHTSSSIFVKRKPQILARIQTTFWVKVVFKLHSTANLEHIGSMKNEEIWLKLENFSKKAEFLAIKSFLGKNCYNQSILRVLIADQLIIGYCG